MDEILVFLFAHDRVNFFFFVVVWFTLYHINLENKNTLGDNAYKAVIFNSMLSLS